MWYLAILTVMMAMVGLYSEADQQLLVVAENRKPGTLAEEMALYRDAVTSYFTANDYRNITVPFATLKAANVVPTWSRLYSQSASPVWTNYRDAAGTIYIYAASLPSVNVVSDIVDLSHNSYLAGQYRAGATTLHSPVFGDTGVPLTSLLNERSLPDGAPVWIGMRR
ncbi:MAG: hypothetical protein JWM42_3472 [Burkholderia sp.]|nr:hypothetical protein [Burkholderia sp.]